MRRFVVVVDMQRDFVLASGALPVPDAEAIVAPANQWLAALDPAGIAGVLFTFDTHVPDIYAGSPEGAQFTIHCVRDTAGWELIVDRAALDPAIPVYALEKGVFDMWAEPDLMVKGPDGAVNREAFFAGLKDRGIDEVLVIGVAADFCVRYAVDGLLRRGFRVAIPAALTRGIIDDMRATAEQHFAGTGLQLVD